MSSYKCLNNHLNSGGQCKPSTTNSSTCDKQKCIDLIQIYTDKFINIKKINFKDFISPEILKVFTNNECQKTDNCGKILNKVNTINMITFGITDFLFEILDYLATVDAIYQSLAVSLAIQCLGCCDPNTDDFTKKVKEYKNLLKPTGLGAFEAIVKDPTILAGLTEILYKIVSDNIELLVKLVKEVCRPPGFGCCDCDEGTKTTPLDFKDILTAGVSDLDLQNKDLSDKEIIEKIIDKITSNVKNLNV